MKNLTVCRIFELLLKFQKKEKFRLKKCAVVVRQGVYTTIPYYLYIPRVEFLLLRSIWTGLEITGGTKFLTDSRYFFYFYFF